MLNKRKPKSFNYESRYSKNDVLSKKAEEVSKSEITDQWHKTRRTGNKSKTGSKLMLLLLLLGTIIVVMYYLEYKL